MGLKKHPSAPIARPMADFGATLRIRGRVRDPSFAQSPDQPETSLHSERGLALPIVLGVLVVLSLLAAALLSTASRSSTDSKRDRASKRALAAAEAGLQTAGYRLKRINPADTMCLTTVAVAPTGGECPASVPEAVGTGASFSYRVTQKGATCSTLPGYTATVNDRCVTSVGVATGAGLAAGVTRRIQARLEDGPAFPFANAGIAGSEWVTMTNDVTIDKKTDVGSNGPITLTGTPGSVQILDQGVARPYPTGSVIRTGTTTIDGGTIYTSRPYGLAQPNFAATNTAEGGTNNNANLVAMGASVYNATTRALTIPGSPDKLLAAGTYNVCSWTMAPGAILDMVSSTAQAKIYLDSPRRAGSGCPAGSGKFLAIGNSADEIKINTGRFDANVTTYIYGTTADASAEDIVMANKAHIDTIWYAPDSIFRASNDVTMHGGVAARKVLMYNNVYAKLDTAVKPLPGPGSILTRRSWAECTPVPTVPADPESGC